MVNSYIHLNLDSGRYEFYGGNLTKKSKSGVLNTNINQNEFIIQALSRAGR